MPKCAGGCGREVASEGDYCKICGYGQSDTLRSNHNVQPIIPAQGTDEDSNSHRLSEFLKGGMSSAANQGPAYRGSVGERMGKIIGPLVGVVVVLVIAGFVAAGIKITAETVGVVSQEVDEQMKEKIERKFNPPSSTFSASFKDKGGNYREVQMSLIADPRPYDGSCLIVNIGETGTIRARVLGIEEKDYYIKWILKPQLVGITDWEQVDHNTINVSFSKKIPWKVIGDKDPRSLNGKNGFRAELYLRSERRLLCTCWMDVQCN
ncbi:hypothetical protein DRH29_01785 [candidate division Kazan bacterium]|uniref:Uncharacterized protein n=1 Tax=candidate division Kazan bacterium TaxID=2202143 RepID=A0A420ZD32_UNCK3|nr:MAG: hypothetical protein DRH29_01785 [candidate division Kazan bacterium]